MGALGLKAPAPAFFSMELIFAMSAQPLSSKVVRLKNTVRRNCMAVGSPLTAWSCLGGRGQSRARAGCSVQRLVRTDRQRRMKKGGTGSAPGVDLEMRVEALQWGSFDWSSPLAGRQAGGGSSDSTPTVTRARGLTGPRSIRMPLKSLISLAPNQCNCLARLRFQRELENSPFLVTNNDGHRPHIRPPPANHNRCLMTIRPAPSRASPNLGAFSKPTPILPSHRAF